MEKKRRRGSNPLPTIALVVGIHVAMGGAVFLIGKTQAGREIMHKISLYQPPKAEDPPAEQPETPEPPPPPPVVEAKIQTPQVNRVAAAAPAPSAGVDIGSGLGGGGGTNWSGGKFVDRMGGGPLGAFHACVTRSYRSCLGKWTDLQARVDFEIRVSGSGKVVSSRMTRSSGNAEHDRVLMDALQCAQRDLRCTLPPEEEKGAVITMKLSPTQGGGIRAE